MQCGNYLIADNNFEQNMGCPTHSTSIIEFECITTSEIFNSYDKVDYQTTFSLSSNILNQWAMNEIRY